MLKMHLLLRDSLELAPSRPLVVLGKVTWVTPKPKFPMPQTISIIPTMRVAIARLFWGYYKESEVIAECHHRDCSNVAGGANVIAYCEPMGGVYRQPPANCRVVSTEVTEENIRRVEQWASHARERQRELIIERVRKSVMTDPSDERLVPSVYRGSATWVGKADNGIPLVHFTDTTGRFEQPINLLIQRHYQTDAPIAVEVGKPMIAFCLQRDNVCYNGDEVTAIIEDSDETFRAIQHLIEQAR